MAEKSGMTINQALHFAQERFQKTSTSPFLDAEVLLAHALKKPKEFLYTHPDKKIPPKTTQKFNILIKKRKLGWPVAYLTGRKEFYGLEFRVNKNVLIPRPETETLVELVLKQIKDLRLKIKVKQPLSILDLGTGSGNIIISLAKTLSQLSTLNSQLFASDISRQALATAKKNAKLHKVKITFKQGSLLTPWKNQKFDIAIANLPYLARKNDPSTKFEPKQALVAKKQGLELIEKLFAQTHCLKYQPQALFLEFDPRQTQTIKNLAAAWLPNYKIKTHKDLSKKTRFISLLSPSAPVFL